MGVQGTPLALGLCFKVLSQFRRNSKRDLRDALKKALAYLESLPRSKRDDFIAELPRKFQEEEPDLPQAAVATLIEVFGRLKRTADRLDRMHDSGEDPSHPIPRPKED